MPELTTAIAVAGKALSSTFEAVRRRKDRKLEKYPIAVSIEVASDDGKQLILLIHADNNSDGDLEVTECYIRRLQTTGGCGEPNNIRDCNLRPESTMKPPVGPIITVPGIGRRSWELKIPYAYIRDTLRRELDDAEKQIYSVEIAKQLKAERDTKRPLSHPLARLDEPQMRLWAIVQLANRERKMLSPSLDIPPLKLVEMLSDWWAQRLQPRLKELRNQFHS